MISKERVRITLRWLHIVLGLIIMCYIYSPFSGNYYFQVVVKFLVIPTITFTGIWLWKFQAFNRFFKIH